MISLQAGSSDLNDLCLKVNRIMDQFMQRSFFRFRPCDRWQPSINLYEMETTFTLCIDLSGIDPKQVEIHAENNVLHIMGQRVTPVPVPGESPRIHVMEIDHGPFYRAVSIPENVEVGKIDARYTNGLLWIALPKKSAR
jgi:HSP20 family protein